MVSVHRVESSRAVQGSIGHRVESIHRSAPRVVIVDDEPDLVELLVGCARDAGFAAHGTTDPLEMLAACERAHVEIVVVDLRMPSVDGIELLRSVAETSHRPDVVLMSGSDTSVLETACQFVETLGLRVRGVMGKPFSPKDFVALLRRPSVDLVHVRSAPTSAPPNIRLPDRLEDAIVAYVQPQVSFVDGRVVGYEALARMRLPDGAVLAPDGFLTEIRRSGRMRELTMVVLDSALAGLAPRWDGAPFHTLSVNVPADTLAQAGFVDEVLRRLREHGTPPWCLTLEITEDELVRRDGATLGALVRLRLAGVGLAIDDFGTGHSTLSQARNVPATELKLDRSFVVGLDSSERAHAIVRNVCRMGRELGLRVVAEGIESAEVAATLASAGCTAGQGYLFGRPIPVDALECAHGRGSPRVANRSREV